MSALLEALQSMGFMPEESGDFAETLPENAYVYSLENVLVLEDEGDVTVSLYSEPVTHELSGALVWEARFSFGIPDDIIIATIRAAVAKQMKT